MTGRPYSKKCSVDEVLRTDTEKCQTGDTESKFVSRNLQKNGSSLKHSHQTSVKLKVKQKFQYVIVYRLSFEEKLLPLPTSSGDAYPCDETRFLVSHS